MHIRIAEGDAQQTIELGSISILKTIFHFSLPWTGDFWMDLNPSAWEDSDKAAPYNVPDKVGAQIWLQRAFADGWDQWAAVNTDSIGLVAGESKKQRCERGEQQKVNTKWEWRSTQEFTAFTKAIGAKINILRRLSDNKNSTVCKVEGIIHDPEVERQVMMTWYWTKGMMCRGRTN